METKIGDKFYWINTWGEDGLISPSISYATVVDQTESLIYVKYPDKDGHYVPFNRYRFGRINDSEKLIFFSTVEDAKLYEITYILSTERYISMGTEKLYEIITDIMNLS